MSAPAQTDEKQDIEQRLIDRIAELKSALGELLIIAPNSSASVRARELIQADSEIAQGGVPRPYGLCAGEFAVADDFDDPLPEEVSAEFNA